MAKGLREEILEQPAVAARLLSEGWENIQRIAAEIKRQQIKYIFLAARGTSDNAGLYAKYLLGTHNRIPVALAGPSLFSIYDAPPHLDGALVLGISQSGQSPDILSVIEEGNRQGVPTLAITNDAASPLGQAATYCIDILAGEEKAVAATKTYMAQLLAIAMLSAALTGEKSQYAALQLVPGYLEQALRLETLMEQAAAPYFYMDQCVVIGRGFNYATAYEWALKLKEMTYVVAEPYSSADFLHGPIAMVESGFPVFMVATQGLVYPQLADLAQLLIEEKRANLFIISDDEKLLDLSVARVLMPAGMPEWISPLVNILPGQLFAYYLTQRRGLSVDSPRGLSKVTKTV
ncbi:SIS domain-containing protein [bacterium]|nr:SIS domain-containing protein [bacterium]